MASTDLTVMPSGLEMLVKFVVTFPVDPNQLQLYSIQNEIHTFHIWGPGGQPHPKAASLIDLSYILLSISSVLFIKQRRLTGRQSDLDNNDIANDVTIELTNVECR